jgi:hypothetical protein
MWQGNTIIITTTTTSQSLAVQAVMHSLPLGQLCLLVCRHSTSSSYLLHQQQCLLQGMLQQGRCPQLPLLHWQLLRVPPTPLALLLQGRRTQGTTMDKPTTSSNPINTWPQ